MGLQVRMSVIIEKAIIENTVGPTVDLVGSLDVVLEDLGRILRYLVPVAYVWHRIATSKLLVLSVINLAYCSLQ
jgi:hypothetical protein